jgi:hypothetical protein
MIELKTSNNYKFLISEKDKDRVEQFKWSVTVGSHGHKYIQGSNHMHLCRFLLQAPKGFEVDHINGNILDNRRENLRLCTLAQNRLNKRVYKNSKSGVKGVFLRPSGTYRAELRAFGKRYRSHAVKTKKEATILYNEMALKYHGEFASLNKI